MTDTLKVLHICGSRYPGGTQHFFLRLVQASHHHSGLQVLSVVREGSWLAGRLEEAGIPHHPLGFRERFDLFTRPALKRLIKDFQPDIAQTWMNRASRYLPRNLVPSVGRVGGYYDLKAYRGLDHLVGASEAICHHIRRSGWPEEKVTYIPHFVELPPHGFKEQGDAVRARHGIPDNVPVLLLAGKLERDKGFDIALKAMEQLPDHVHALIAGEGDEKASLEAQVLQSALGGRVHFTGWMNSITPLCAAADILVSAAREDPLGSIILEGWAHAIPVIATETAGTRKIIIHGQDGLLVPTGNPAELAQAIQRIIQNPGFASELAETGLATLTRSFSEKEVVGRYVALYHIMIASYGQRTAKGG